MSAEPDAYAEDRARLVLDLRGSGVQDQRVIEAMERTPREMFVPESFRRHAYDDTALPLALGQTVSQPSIVGMMTEALEPHPRAKALEIGCGSGYQAVVLSQLVRRVYTVERIKALLREAERRFHELGRGNITTRHGDGMKGWPEQAPFECILVTAAASDQVPQALIDQLAVGGRLVAPVGGNPLSQRLIKLVKQEDGSTVETELCLCRFVPLLGGVE
ncbi:MAG: protein-L-isoaspartate(D-aspartate) O-methyltransferase [Alphaproteobacteria bacterium]|nr:protein-L-isoaspartate(D-aspartate) O-methyltransferase [Alphaproteobacteria bacterium]